MHRKNPPAGRASLVIAAVLTAIAVYAAGDTSQTPPVVSGPETFASSLDAIQREAATLPATSVDPAAKAAALGGTTESAFAFVRDEIHDEVYAGVLRGARGTLLAGAGNDCDKSLLLATLLRTRGLKVRFVRGHLARERADAIVGQMFASVPKPGRLVPSSPQAGEAPARSTVRALLERWNTNAEDLRSVLHRDGVALGRNSPTPRNTLVAEASDHTWIEVEQGETWTALDPAFSDAKAGEAFATPEAKADDLPASLAHTITIHLVADERTGSAIVSHDVLRYQDTAAALNGALVALNTRLDVTPTGWMATPFIQVGDRFFSGAPFTATGIVRKTIGQAMSGGLSAVAQALGSAPAAAAASQPELAAVWLVVDFHSPLGRTETVRRAFLDRVGPAARASHQDGTTTLAPIALVSGRPVALAGLYACAFSAGRFPPGFVAAALASRLPDLRAAAPFVAAIASGREGAGEESLQRAGDFPAAALPALLQASALAFYRVSQASLELVRSQAPASVWFYAAAPRLVITSLELVPAPDGKSVRVQSSVDLRRNDMRVVSAEADESQVVWSNVLRGVLDGALEQTLFGDLGSNDARLARSVSTTAVFGDARAENTRRIAIRTPGALASLHLPDAARARMQAALESGSTALVAPERALSIRGEPHVGWWQIDLATGETLGVLETGLHQAEEYEEVTMVSRVWTGPAPTPSVWSIETQHGAIVATSEEAGLAADAEEVTREIAQLLRNVK
jgi:hypothetical protein